MIFNQICKNEHVNFLIKNLQRRGDILLIFFDINFAQKKSGKNGDHIYEKIIIFIKLIKSSFLAIF